MPGRLVVSLHDVCPAFEPACRGALAALDALGLRRRSLLVIPHHAGGSVDGTPAHAAWLRERAAAGDEIVHHGWRHGREHPPARGAWRLVDAVLARGSAEFLGADLDEATAWLNDGRRRLADAGLEAVGFTAPAWLYSPEAARAVSDGGFRYLTTHLRLRELPSGRSVWAFGTSNRPGPPAGDLIGRAVNEALVALHQPAPVIRVAVHPADLLGRRPFEHTLSLLRRLLRAGWQPVRYRDLLEAPR